MGDIRGGARLFFRLKALDYLEAVQFTRESASVTTGWQYEDTTDNWNAVTAGGVSPQHADGVNRIKYTVQAGDALSADNDNDYSASIEQGEFRDRS